jgi:hypothetical protein
VSLVVGPVTLPAYLDHIQVIAMGGTHEVALNEFTRWAEPLRDAFSRVLVENLSLLLETPAVSAYDRGPAVSSDFQIVIDVTRFDVDAGGQACLTAFWTVDSPEGGNAGLIRKSHICEAAASMAVLDRVEAQNRVLNQYSRDIAAAVRTMRP